MCLSAEAQLAVCVGEAGAKELSAARQQCSEEQAKRLQDMDDAPKSEGESAEEGEACNPRRFHMMTLATRACMYKKMGWMSDDYELQPKAIQAVAVEGPLKGRGLRCSLLIRRAIFVGYLVGTGPTQALPAVHTVRAHVV